MMPSLDLLILSLVEAGIDTPYRWQSRAGLSLGGTLPAVRRLLARHLVSEAAAGPRGRREFTITAAGRRSSSVSITTWTMPCLSRSGTWNQF